MDIFLLTFGFILMILGIIGSFLPVLPGPPMSWFGILLLYFTTVVPFDYWILGITFFIATIITILDYIIPAIGTKKFGGTKYGMWGSTIGLIVGLIFPIPLGFIFGAIFGAFIGELLYDSKDTKRATKAALGSFYGLLTSTFLKLIVSISFLILFINIFWKYRTYFF